MKPKANSPLAAAVELAMGKSGYAIQQLMACKGFPGRPKPEEAICLAFTNEMRRRVKSGAFPGLFLHIPNEGKRSHLTGQRLKALGMIPGAPDYLLLWQSKLGRMQVVFIEFKAKGGKESPYQALFARWCEHAHVKRFLCYSSDEALAVLAELEAFT